MGKFFLETYGCQMNVAESFSVERELTNLGWQQAESETEADLVILNTCAVRNSAEQRIHGRIGYYQHLKQSKPLSLVVMGCMTERMNSSLRKSFPAVDMLVGTFGKRDFLNFVSRTEDLRKGLKDFFGEEVYEFLSAEVSPGGFSAYVPIMHGCNNFCTYCIVPYVRGREISRKEDEILEEVRRLDARGVREITLIGQNVNSYRGDKGADFPALLQKLEDGMESIHWIRFMSSHPKDLSDRLINVIAQSDRMCSHIHLPVQHGSNPVLSRMNRGYTREYYLSLVEKLRKAVPGCSLSTDLLVGFPGEGDEDFTATLELLDRVRFDDAFTYKYNSREGTAAASYEDQVPEQKKNERLSMLIDFQRKITEDNKKKRIGKTVKVLVEGVSKKNPHELLGRTERNEMVVFPAAGINIGDFIEVRLDALAGVTFRATRQF
ncbi:tRNA (N6-isopentenyl adenosine(37)-C2)-methylthiotransferase MiaB [Marispirochaeta aestuarii]|uniref:tRNA-2-methylthio-N(6)-dimethylallyladenosine synthase n=1 Tax=Marispirochaeta aestuarii TaxID=1963862 RepID=A0A1Y1S1G7_9SPIO|nr:tRNA (N6-isopentenyl adenosine(37)-C2)-methylthiotransferase MiaB [Marispirochaeta aestuarii]ORC37321.1 tRNA (N6-isopentenyl adenosine(37)-C2)-methylthiotransferase MiaB [Marispirochaeta aestuarii]